MDCVKRVTPLKAVLLYPHILISHTSVISYGKVYLKAEPLVRINIAVFNTEFKTKPPETKGTYQIQIIVRLCSSNEDNGNYSNNASVVLDMYDVDLKAATNHANAIVKAGNLSKDYLLSIGFRLIYLSRGFDWKGEIIL